MGTPAPEGLRDKLRQVNGGRIGGVSGDDERVIRQTYILESCTRPHDSPNLLQTPVCKPSQEWSARTIHTILPKRQRTICIGCIIGCTPPVNPCFTTTMGVEGSTVSAWFGGVKSSPLRKTQNTSDSVWLFEIDAHLTSVCNSQHRPERHVTAIPCRHENIFCSPLVSDVINLRKVTEDAISCLRVPTVGEQPVKSIA